jgi:hypothetical protein
VEAGRNIKNAVEQSRTVNLVCDMDNRVDKIRTVELFTVPRIAQCYCVHLNGCIDDNNVVYTTKIEGYTTSMSYMNELGEMAERDVIL